jgi:hypothetical protein
MVMDGEGSVQIAGSVEKIEIETLERENSRKEVCGDISPSLQVMNLEFLQ